jgi:hypothetical protein
MSTITEVTTKCDETLEKERAEHAVTRAELASKLEQLADVCSALAAERTAHAATKAELEQARVYHRQTLQALAQTDTDRMHAELALKKELEKRIP